MKVQGEAMDETSCADLATVGPIGRAVQPSVEFEVDVLGELDAAQFALIWLFSRVQTQVSLQVAGAAEAFVTHLWRFKDKDLVI